MKMKGEQRTCWKSALISQRDLLVWLVSNHFSLLFLDASQIID